MTILRVESNVKLKFKSNELKGQYGDDIHEDDVNSKKHRTDLNEPIILPTEYNRKR